MALYRFTFTFEHRHHDLLYSSQYNMLSLHTESQKLPAVIYFVYLKC